MPGCLCGVDRKETVIALSPIHGVSAMPVSPFSPSSASKDKKNKDKGLISYMDSSNLSRNRHCVEKYNVALVIFNFTFFSLYAPSFREVGQVSLSILLLDRM